MVDIESVIAEPVTGGFFFDDQRAIKGGAQRDGFIYEGSPVTPGFEHIRQPAEAISILLELSNGQVAVGDCAAVQYAGTADRETVFRAEQHKGVIMDDVTPLLEGRSADSFRDSLAAVDTDPINESHPAVRYGVSQALLDAAALSTHRPMTDVIAEEYGMEPATTPVPVYSQSGDTRRINSDKMILKQVDVLPHGLFTSMEDIGHTGTRLVEFIEWLTSRVQDIGPDGYRPTLHVDIYGNLSELFDPPYTRQEVLEYITKLDQAAGNHTLQLEDPIRADTKLDQIREMKALRERIQDSDLSVKLVADEWCNTLDDIRSFVDGDAADIVQVKTPDLGGIHQSIEAIGYCKGSPVEGFLGGSCVETDVSARVSAHVALATKPTQVLAKPGMGVDEGITIIRNEMARTIALRNHRETGP